MSILKLLGFDTKKPLDFLVKMLKTVGKDKLIDELADTLKNRTTPARKAVIINNLKSMAADLEKGDFKDGSTKLVELLFSIKM